MFCDQKLSPLQMSAVMELVGVNHMLLLRRSGSTGEEGSLETIARSRVPLVACLPRQPACFSACSSLVGVRVPVASLNSILAVPNSSLSPLDFSCGGSLLSKLTQTMCSIRLEVNFDAAATNGCDYLEQVSAGVAPKVTLLENLQSPTHKVCKNFGLSWAGSCITFKRAECIERIGGNFMKNTKFLTDASFGMPDEDHDNFGIRSKYQRALTFKNTSEISSGFLQGSSLLKRVDLCGFVHVTSIKSHFLDGCSSLEAIDLKPFQHLKVVGNFFLANCVAVTVVDVTALCNSLEQIGDNCFFSCRSLVAFDVKTPMTKLTSIGANFGAGCGITSFCSRWMGTEISLLGRGFLSGCSRLRTAMIGDNLSKLTAIEGDFMSDCSSLSEVVMESECFPLVTVIGENFLKGSGIESILPTNTPFFPSLTDIGDGFCEQCCSLAQVDASLFPVLQRIGSGFAAECSKLAFVGLESLTSLQTIGNNFLKDCVALSVLQLPAGSLVRVGDNFGRTSGIKEFSFSGQTNLTSIGHSCLSESKVTSVSCKGLQSINRIGGSFLANCRGLTSLETDGLQTLSILGPEFLQGCIRLGYVDLTPLGSLTHLGRRFLDGCSSLDDVDLRVVSHVLHR